jgi:hypothetical protein
MAAELYAARANGRRVAVLSRRPTDFVSLPSTFFSTGLGPRPVVNHRGPRARAAAIPPGLSTSPGRSAIPVRAETADTTGSSDEDDLKKPEVCRDLECEDA